MIKQGLIDAVAAKTGISQRQAKLVVNAVFESISETLEQGEPVMVSGFGTFDVRDTAVRHGRNMMTGEFVMIQPKKMPTFKSSRVLKERIENMDL